MQSINTAQEFNQLVNNNTPVLLDFYAEWCGPCQTLLPVVDELATKHQDNIQIAKVNVDEFPALAREFGVRSIPALFFIKDKKVVEQLVGMQSKKDLETKILKHSA